MNQSPTPAELYNSILRQMRAQGRPEREIQLVAEYLTGQKTRKKPAGHVCVVCQVEPVCPEDGQDTCADCARRI